MSQKQNNKYVLGRLYPEYFKQPTLPKIQQNNNHKLVKSRQDQKIESKLKKIIYSLERQIQQQFTVRRSKIRDQEDDQISQFSNAPSRSYSLKILGPSTKVQRIKTKQQDGQFTDKTSRKQSIKKIRKQSQSKKKLYQGLVLPKIKQNRYKKLQKLNQKQQQYGKIVLQKVEKHFQMEKQGRHRYFERVKSEQDIDSSFLTYLKNKIKKANLIVQK